MKAIENSETNIINLQIPQDYRLRRARGLFGRHCPGTSPARSFCRVSISLSRGCRLSRRIFPFRICCRRRTIHRSSPHWRRYIVRSHASYRFSIHHCTYLQSPFLRHRSLIFYLWSIDLDTGLHYYIGIIPILILIHWPSRLRIRLDLRISWFLTHFYHLPSNCRYRLLRKKSSYLRYIISYQFLASSLR